MHTHLVYCYCVILLWVLCYTAMGIVLYCYGYCVAHTITRSFVAHRFNALFSIPTKTHKTYIELTKMCTHTQTNTQIPWILGWEVGLEMGTTQYVTHLSANNL